VAKIEMIENEEHFKIISSISAYVFQIKINRKEKHFLLIPIEITLFVFKLDDKGKQ
jgi:hypothetical protein